MDPPDTKEFGPLARFLEELGEEVYRENGHYRAICPVCQARRHSLVASIGEESGNRKLLLHCHAGCETEDILEALGLGWGDLYEGGRPGRRAGRAEPARGRGEIEETYDYYNLAGELVFQVLRLRDPKDFRQRRPDGRGGWIWSTKDVPKIPYKLPELMEAIARGERVLYCEGEKDADRAREVLGIVATTSPEGAGSWRGEFASFFMGARVTIIPDNDAQGRDHAYQVGNELLRYAKGVQLLELPGLPAGGDLSDWLDAGGDADELRSLVERAPAHVKTAMDETTSQLHSPYIAGEVMKLSPRPRLQVKKMRDIPSPGPRRDIIETLVPEGEPTSIHGFGGTTKSYLGVALVMSVAAGLLTFLGHRISGARNVLFIDFELQEAEQRRRSEKIAAGLGIEIPENFLHLAARGFSPLETFTHAYGYCEANDIGVILIDSVGLAMIGDAGKYYDVISFHRDNLDLFAAKGVTPIVIDHQSNLQAGESYQSKAAFGSSYKHNLVRSRIQVQKMDSLDKDSIEIMVRQAKNNLGAEADPMKLVVAFRGDEVTLTRTELTHSDILGEENISKRQRLIMQLSEGPQWPRELAEKLDWTSQAVANASRTLREEGLVERTGTNEGNSHELQLTAKGLEHYERFLKEIHAHVQKAEDPDEDPDPDPPGPIPIGPGPGDGGAAPTVEEGTGGRPPVVEDAEALRTLIDELAASEEIAFDLETMPPAGWVWEAAAGYRAWRRGLKNKPKRERQRKKWDELKEKTYKAYATDPETAQVRLVSIATREDVRALVDAAHVDPAPLFEALRGKTLIVHNASFDVAVLRERYGYVHEGRILDTSLLYLMYHYAHDGQLSANREGKWRVPDPLRTKVKVGESEVSMLSLAHVASRFLSDEDLDKSNQSRDWSIPELPAEALAYALKDAEVLVPLAEELVERLDDIGMGEIVELEARALPAKVWMERNGMYADAGLAREMAERYNVEAEAALAKLTELLPRGGAAPGGGPWAWSNPAHIRAALELLRADLSKLDKTGKTKEPSTAKGSLGKIKKPAAAVSWVESYLEWKNLQKRSNDFVNKYAELVRADGTIAAAFETISTGRFNCTAPNLQQVPARGELQSKEGMRIRDIFRAPAGEKLIVADFEQVELLIAATIAERESKVPSRMLEVFRRGGIEGDIHRATAAAVLSKEPAEITKTERSLAKAINFGLIYGCSPERLLSSAVNDYKIPGMVLADAEKYRASFFEKYPEFKAWHEMVKKACKRNIGYMTTPLGRRRKSPRYDRKGAPGEVAFTSAVNHPVQGAGADALKLAMAMIFERREELGAVLRGSIHDETIASTAAESAARSRDLIGEIMAEAVKLATKDPESPISVDVGVKQSWGEK